jgi:4a-hydroxytetrahydrobiopterin dehydratase
MASNLKKCRSAKKLTDEEINERMKKVDDGWILCEGRLTKTFDVGNKKRDSFSRAFSIAQIVAQTAERHCHHPEIIINWGSCKVSFWTHFVDGLSAADFEMVGRVEDSLLRGVDEPLFPYPTSLKEVRESGKRYSLPPSMEMGTYGSSPDPRKKRG